MRCCRQIVVGVSSMVVVVSLTAPLARGVIVPNSSGRNTAAPAGTLAASGWQYEGSLGSFLAEVRTASGALKGWQWGVQDGVQGWGQNTISDSVDGGTGIGSLLKFNF